MKHKFVIYKIFYTGPGGEWIAYVGRTKQSINSRLRGHFKQLPMHKKIDIFFVSRIEIAECRTEADMFLYELYYINKFRPALNRDDKAQDELTVSLPELDFKEYICPLMEKWKKEIYYEEHTDPFTAEFY
jgi:Nuclease subunit of the excinuclease complex